MGKKVKVEPTITETGSPLRIFKVATLYVLGGSRCVRLESTMVGDGDSVRLSSALHFHLAIVWDCPAPYISFVIYKGWRAIVFHVSIWLHEVSQYIPTKAKG